MNNFPNQPLNQSPYRTGRRRVLNGFLVVLFGVIMFASGLVYGGINLSRLSTTEILDAVVGRAAGNVNDKTVDFDTYWKVWQAIGQEFAGGDFTERQVFYGSVAGMVAGLGDPYSVFLDPDASNAFDQEIEGKFEGIGAEIGFKDEHLVIVSPLPGSPAEKAGLKANDAILAINDEDTTGMSVETAVGKIRGPKGEALTLTIKREAAEPQAVTIIRDTITVASVTWNDLPDGLVQIVLSRFSQDTQGLFNEAVQHVLESGATGVILDMRNNPGGYLDTAVGIAGQFLGDQPIVLEQFRAGDPQVYNGGSANARLLDMPLVVLVNGGSASAAEIVAGALQDYERAAIIGETTFGKGSVQDLKDFPDGSSLKLTVAQWLTPDGRSISQTGITPDRVVELTEDDYTNDRDPQLDAAKAALGIP